MPPHANIYLAAGLVALATALAFTAILRAFTAGSGGVAPERRRPTAPDRRRRAAAGRRRSTPRPYSLDDYGLLRTLALVESLDTAQSVRALLDAGGVRATVATGPDGLTRVLVFPESYDRARRMVSWVL